MSTIRNGPKDTTSQTSALRGFVKPGELGNTEEIGHTQSIGEVKKGGGIEAGSGFDRISSVRDSSSGFSRLNGSVGTQESKAGFGLLSLTNKWHSLTDKAQKTLATAALGFMLLVPPGVGQMMNPGVPQAKLSPVAMQMQQKAELPSGAQIQAEAQSLRSHIPQGVGPQRESAVLKVMQSYERSSAKTEKARALVGDAHKTLGELKSTVALDAKMGYAVDWYWFGVPEHHANFHAGTADVGVLDRDLKGMDAGVASARSTARESVSDLLRAESAPYASLHADYKHETNKLERATQIHTLADQAVSSLTTASHAVMMRNVTPRTITVDDYTTNDKGERVRSGSHEETNPTWTMWNLAAIAAKASAEANVKHLNTAVKDAAQLLELNPKQVDANLIGALDFFGHPSFLVWSFDSGDVSRATDAAKDLRTSISVKLDQIRPVQQKLEREVNQQIDARWTQLKDGPIGNS
jgi:hypothetical protein